ncbi:hypothetical protein ACFVOO_32380 [Streptomyces rochei]|uniref:hypothetical protein n=1 Tax=Streptomyces TaxID=1883 RepID=UPI000374F28F|nr:MULTISPECIES: hypothetical protein [Streptomyces]WDI23302.1 hypothetical protein PS783_37355 [Streptomyces enissocaesilis]WMI61873.1 hypothetical protein RBH85_36015 [Streptomyces rochei]
MVLLRRQELAVDVEFYALWAEDADEADPGESPDPVEEGLLLSADRHLCIGTGGHTHQAAFVTEVWDEEPPQADVGAWEGSADAEWYCRSGEVMLWSYGGPSEPAIELGRSDTWWRVRVRVAGRRRVRELAQQEVPVGVERFLLQFWPA